jgi:hypothetical protein
MNDLLLQIILARRSDDAEKWTNVLFVVVLALFWLVGGIIKAKSSRTEAQGKQPPRKPARKPPVHSREAREQMLSRLQRPSDSAHSQSRQPRPAADRKPRMKFADLQAAVRKFAVEAEKAFQADTVETTPGHKPILEKPKTKAEKMEFSEPVGKIVKGLQDKQASEAEQISEPAYLPELLADYSDPEQLKRAILHYEILGRPLSLRETFEEGN